MPITDSGQIALIADIEAEFDQTGTTDISLFQARDDAGLSAGQVAMSDFYSQSNSGTLTIQFVDNTPTGASMSTSSISITGSPGSAISTQTRTISRAANYSLSNVTVSESGDSGNNLSATGSLASGSTGFQNGQVQITGTIPSGTVTVTYTVSCTASAKLSRGCGVSGSFPGSNGGYGSISMSFSGGGTGYGYFGGSVDSYGSFSGGWYNGISSGGSGTTLQFYCSSGNGSLTSMYSGYSVGETATYASCSAGQSRSY